MKWVVWGDKERIKTPDDHLPLERGRCENQSCGIETPSSSVVVWGTVNNHSNEVIHSEQFSQNSREEMWAPVAFIAPDLDGSNHVAETENLNLILKP